MNIAMLKIFRCKPSPSMCSLARRVIVTALVAVFTTCSAAAATGAPPSPQAGLEKAPTVGESIPAMPPHTKVQVKLHNKKIRGRVSVVTGKGGGKGTTVSAHIVVEGGAGVDIRIEH